MHWCYMIIQWFYCWNKFQTYIACYMLLGDMIFQLTFIFKLLIAVVTFIYICFLQHVEFLVMIKHIRCTFKFLATNITFKNWFQQNIIRIIAFFIRNGFNFPNFFINDLTLLSFKKGLLWSSDSFSSMISIFWFNLVSKDSIFCVDSFVSLSRVESLSSMSLIPIQ